MDQFEIYSGGEFITTDQALEVRNPFDGSLVAGTWLAGGAELEKAIGKAQGLAGELSRMPLYGRYEILMMISKKIRRIKEEFARLLSLESGKPWKYAFAEVQRAIDTFVIAAEETRRLPRESMGIDWTQAGHGKEGLVKYFPVGLVAGISPFNFPLNLAVHKIAPAIAAGCPIILKPSTSTPLSTLQLARILDGTDLPKGAVSVLPMDRRTGNQLVTDERFKLLTFTGSPEVGWKMKQEAGKKKVVLELGGNAGAIITDSADLETAAGKCVTGGYSYSGQVCIHTQRIFADRKVFQQFAQLFQEKVKNLVKGNPLDPHTDISVMIDEYNAVRVEEWVNEAVKDGAKILCGGKRSGAYYEPTLLTNTFGSMKVCSLEVFGPVVILEPYDSFGEAVEMVNQGRYGLQAGVFTNRIDQMNQAFEDLQVGGVILNDVPTFRADHMPYGGIKDSGLGREGVKYAIHDMMEPKILVKNM